MKEKYELDVTREHVRSQQPDSETIVPGLLRLHRLRLSPSPPIEMQAPHGQDVIKIDGNPAVRSEHLTQH
ncbi:hypothetical protein AAFF_G00151270 [Aldrovandia affinis]|uniref:Uncharacterized protein n=1 Tax=Aldrovandia affinis TaxID=143900 RepID=A0AAD7RRL5_9TELE|nr:hypothetical protein AAFF_G00151270 [Aldrovandia affinis]